MLSGTLPEGTIPNSSYSNSSLLVLTIPILTYFLTTAPLQVSLPSRGLSLGQGALAEPSVNPHQAAHAEPNR